MFFRRGGFETRPCRAFPVDTASAVKSSQNARHCERSEAIHVAIPAILDCFVASLLAMTEICVGVSVRTLHATSLRRDCARDGR
ncbi:MAG: hypothetical protein LBG78_03070 [Azoarcus sp.]|nr:hypothetical protein [Azoarcus sp.]